MNPRFSIVVPLAPGREAPVLASLETMRYPKNGYEVIVDDGLNPSLELMLHKTRFGDSLQSGVIVPYPGTPLYDEALRECWFAVDPED